jgi:predicted RecB family nuclease
MLPAMRVSTMISSHLFEAYLECPTKCWLRAQREPSTGNVYAEWAVLKNESYRKEWLERRLAIVAEPDRILSATLETVRKEATWRFAVDMRVQADDLECRIPAVERIRSEGRGRRLQFIPYRFEFSNKLSKQHKLMIAFDAVVLSEATGRDIRLGKIIHGDRFATLNVKTSSLIIEVRSHIKSCAALAANTSPPDLVLNRHCGQCEFQARCHKQAREKDDLSLLGGMSDKERKKLHDKGIFTVTQLSYTFRPRRRSHDARNRKEKYHHSLRALAIRKDKIHAVDVPDEKLDGTPVYLDVEGLPDRDFYYLIGVRVENGDGAVQHGFWADDADGEKRIWEKFQGILAAISNPRIICYGSYETAFLKRMRERYGGPREGSAAAIAIAHPTNLLSLIYSRIYFPTFSNGLKNVAGYLGFQWSGSPASGLEAIVWRYRWEASRDHAERQALLDYNRQDCDALQIVANKVVDLYCAAPGSDRSPQSEVVRTSDMKRESPYGFKREFVFPALEAINKAAYWNYQRERVYVKSRYKTKCRPTRKAKRKIVLRPNASIKCPRASRCPACNSKLIYRHGGKRSSTRVDLKFMRYGVKRWIARYIIQRYRCRSCLKTFYSPGWRWTGKYGPDLVAYTIYQNIELRIPQSLIAVGINQLFGLDISRKRTNKFKSAAAQIYEDTYNKLLKGLCKGRLLHIDETSISIKEGNGYVWVLTSLEEVVYLYTPTREGSTIQSMLKNFSGVLVTDFYAAYDGIECPQQKCLIHLIRDLNDELLRHPYDDGLRRILDDFSSVVRPIVETVDRRGLKSRFLRKHRGSVDRFYKRLTAERGSSDATKKVVDRLTKSQKRLFTFLDYDDVPWNNNNAEHAIKAFAMLRPVIEGTTTEKGIHEYLVLLSVCETCRLKDVNFLDFLRSGMKNIDKFVTRGRTN